MAYHFCPHKCGNQYDWSADAGSDVPCPNCGRTVWVDRLGLPFANPSLTARIPIDSSWHADRSHTQTPDAERLKVCTCPTSWLPDTYRRRTESAQHLTGCDLYIKGGSW